ncbi:MAG: glutamate-1-semialdehyde 2,1-aminomutase [Lachnospiraceae bacterium]
MTNSEKLFQEAVKVIPGGVNSPVRAFGSIGSTPRFIKSGEGAFLYDEDGNKYIDYIGSWGPMILGHNEKEIQKQVIEACKRGLSYGAATRVEVDMAKLVCELVPSIEMVRMVNSGTEAVMSAIRTARGYTKRDKIIKFTGCYHGHSDGLLVKAGSGVMTAGVPDSLGVPKGYTQDTLSAEYNDLTSVKAHFSRCGEEIAAIIVEPVAANMGVIPPNPGFLEGLRDLCDTYGALLIFDEVITGFRLGIDGAQGYYKVRPDLTTFGKIIGGGMPVGAYGGRREIMEMVAPLGGVYQAGTLSGNPVAMAAGIAQLTILKEHPQYYQKLNQTSDWFFEEMQKMVTKNNLHYQVNHVGSLGCLFFTKVPVTDYESAKTSDTQKFAFYCKNMMKHGIYLAPAQFEAIFLSLAHTKEILLETLECMNVCIKERNN